MYFFSNDYDARSYSSVVFITIMLMFIGVIAYIVSEPMEHSTVIAYIVMTVLFACGTSLAIYKDEQIKYAQKVNEFLSSMDIVAFDAGPYWHIVKDVGSNTFIHYVALHNLPNKRWNASSNLYLCRRFTVFDCPLKDDEYSVSTDKWYTTYRLPQHVHELNGANNLIVKNQSALSGKTTSFSDNAIRLFCKQTHGGKNFPFRLLTNNVDHKDKQHAY